MPIAAPKPDVLVRGEPSLKVGHAMRIILKGTESKLGKVMSFVSIIPAGKDAEEHRDGASRAQSNPLVLLLLRSSCLIDSTPERSRAGRLK